MIKKVLFDGEVEVGISDIDDGNMRFFDGGNESEVINNQEKLGELVGLSGDKIARVRTIYDERDIFTDYQEIMKNNLVAYSINNSEKTIPITDGLVTRCSDVGLLLPLADCLGIVVYDKKQKMVGLLHAGRHNVEQFGPSKFIEYMKNEFGCEAKDLNVFYSPYAIDYRIVGFDNKKLSELATEQLLDAGITLKNIIDSRIDTVNNNSYPSHSNGNTKTRFAVIVKQV